MTAREVVCDSDICSQIDESLCEVTSDESGTSSDEYGGIAPIHNEWSVRTCLYFPKSSLSKRVAQLVDVSVA